MRRVTAISAALIPAVFLLTACGSGSSEPSISRPTTATTSKKVVLTAVKVAVTPSTELQDGQKVNVHVQGFMPGVPEIKFYLSECQSATEVNPLGCGEQLAAQPFGLTDSSGGGSGTTSFPVHGSAATAPLNSALVPCAGTCVIVATTGAAGEYGFAPIAFAQ